VLEERGEEVAVFKRAIEDAELGIVGWGEEEDDA
jgi:hypothetical protein